MEIAAADDHGETTGAGGRAEVLAELFDQNFAALRRLAFVLLGDASAADEVAQDAFVRLYASWRRLDQIDHPPTYLRKIVLNLCRTRGRRAALQRRSQGLLGRDEATRDPDVALRLDVWRALAALPQRQRACAVLRYLEDLSEADVAEILGCSIGTVKSQLHRARAKLEAALAPGRGETT